MSTVELAVRKVKRLSARQSIQRLKAWQNSVRGVTDWEPPKMPDDLVNPVRL